MQDAKNLKEYRVEIEEPLARGFLNQTLDTYAGDYQRARAAAFADGDINHLIAEVVKVKDAVLPQLHALFLDFKKNAEAAGVKVHFAKTATEARALIVEIANTTGSKKIVKSKSMTAEEIRLNPTLLAHGLFVTETDLGDWIMQLRQEGPSHMILPALHLSRLQVAELLADFTGTVQEPDIEQLVKLARHQLRKDFIEADMGISGANFAIADSGTIGLVTNEGNARLVTTLPRVHVVLMGIDKLVPHLSDCLKILKVLPPNATGQTITSYVTWITGANECLAASDKKKDIHVVVLDNGRLEIAGDPLFSQVIRCVRCGACANVCPIYRLVGGHAMGHIYMGAIGLILTYFFHGPDKAKNIVQTCINCQACKDICAAGIDLPRLIKEVHVRIQKEKGRSLSNQLLGRIIANRQLFHALLRTAGWAQMPLAGKDGFLQHLPMMACKKHDFKALPTIAEKPFRDLFPKLPQPAGILRLRIALFSGCVQDFIYPEQMEAAFRLFAARKVAMTFPMGQSCCGQPLQMLAEPQAARDIAIHNIRAFENEEIDYIVTLCASCASHLKHGYPLLLANDPALFEKTLAFAVKVFDFSSFVYDILGLKAEDFSGDGRRVTFHAPCHLCRGLGVHEAPRELLQATGLAFLEAEEAEVCCGFGGTYSTKFPEISRRMLNKKLDNIENSGAEILATDCPGCIMQLRGGLKKRNSHILVRHTAEILASYIKTG